MCTVCPEKINFTHQHGKERLEKHESSKKHKNLHHNNGPKYQTSVVNLYQNEIESEKRRKWKIWKMKMNSINWLAKPKANSKNQKKKNSQIQRFNPE